VRTFSAQGYFILTLLVVLNPIAHMELPDFRFCVDGKIRIALLNVSTILIQGVQVEAFGVQLLMEQEHLVLSCNLHNERGSAKISAEILPIPYSVHHSNIFLLELFLGIPIAHKMSWVHMAY
jgi:hypothetical protein